MKTSCQELTARLLIIYLENKNFNNFAYINPSVQEINLFTKNNALELIKYINNIIERLINQ